MEVEDESQVSVGDFHQVLSDFSTIHANMPIWSMLPGSQGILSKQRKEMLMEQVRHFLCDVSIGLLAISQLCLNTNSKSFM